MVVRSILFDVSGDVSRCAAVVYSDAAVCSDFTVKFLIHAPIEPPEPAGDAWLVALLLPAMFTGEDLEIRAPVSARLVRQVVDAQIILRSWWPEYLTKIKVLTPKIVNLPSRPEEQGPTASFFSGGVDSWYSLQKHINDISTLITVKGFDLPFQDESVWPQIVEANTRVAAQLGKELICIQTDIRERLDPSYACFHRKFLQDFWGQCMHGACMAAAALLLQNRFARVIIPASMEYSYLPPWGSHPLLDPLWSNGQVRFIHDGCEELRLEKLRAIARFESVLQHLRVCPANIPGRYNCGTCEKCQRTMLTLRLFGVLDRATCFDKPIDFDAMELYPLTPIYFPTYREILKESVATGDAEVERLVRVLIHEKRSWRREWHSVRTNSTRLASSILRFIGDPRWKKSISKRINYLRNRSAAIQPSRPKV